MKGYILAAAAAVILVIIAGYWYSGLESIHIRGRDIKINFVSHPTEAINVTVDGKVKAASSGGWVNKAFAACVGLLFAAARLTCMTYEEINILIFCIFGPLLFFYMFVRLIVLKRKLKIIVGNNETAN